LRIPDCGAADKQHTDGEGGQALHGDFLPMLTELT
jgi:hypothetical protein